MALVPARFRPFVAALLGMIVTGLGHLYLRRWLRAVVWVALAFVVSVAFVPQSAAEAILAGEQVDPLALLPGAIVGIGSAVDAFRIARSQQSAQPKTVETDEQTASATQADTSSTGDPEPEDETIDCPACGKPVDPTLGFCHWCTTEFETQTDGAD
ncbi:zinc ribbon domain-containing protein [Halolamina sp.]|jgi:hypothetical protein|uniref:zinc ribbon domain-containing protein n=1 Tax=Halolamina sp. TaxID=1940283 RepID=UPI000223B8E1|nr:hypothetical protein Halar_1792 [halophilic archaeon DL31]